MIARFQKTTPRLGLLAMVLFLGLGLVALTDASAASQSVSERLDGPVALEVEDANLLEVFDAFTAATGITFEFTPEAMDVVNGEMELGIQVDDTSAKSVLGMLTRTSGLAFAVEGDHIKISKDPNAHHAMRVIQLDELGEDGEVHVVSDVIIGSDEGDHMEHGMVFVEDGEFQTDENGNVFKKKVRLRVGEGEPHEIILEGDNDLPHGVKVIELNGEHGIECPEGEECEIKVMALHGNDFTFEGHDFECPEGEDCGVRVMAHAMFIDEDDNVTKLGEGDLPEGLEWHGDDEDMEKHIRIIKQKLADGDLPEGVKVVEGTGPHVIMLKGEDVDVDGEHKVIIKKLHGDDVEWTSHGEHDMMFVSADGEGLHKMDKQVFILKGADADDLPEHLQKKIDAAEAEGAGVEVIQDGDKVKVIITKAE